jgi:hypothetical protein
MPPQLGMSYVRLPLMMDMSQTAFAQAAEVVGPAFSYNLYVASPYLNYARRLARELLADNKDNPFAPYLNVLPDDSLGREWVLEANGQRVGSEMC